MVKRGAQGGGGDRQPQASAGVWGGSFEDSGALAADVGAQK